MVVNYREITDKYLHNYYENSSESMHSDLQTLVDSGKFVDLETAQFVIFQRLLYIGNMEGMHNFICINSYIVTVDIIQKLQIFSLQSYKNLREILGIPIIHNLNEDTINDLFENLLCCYIHSNNRLNIIKELIEDGIDFNKLTTTNKKRAICYTDDVVFVELMLDNGLMIDFIDMRVFAQLFNSHHYEILKLLYQHGVNFSEIVNKATAEKINSSKNDLLDNIGLDNLEIERFLLLSQLS